MNTTGFQGGYGTWTRGARVVHLNLQSLTEVSSYIRLEDGEIIDKFPKIETNSSTKLGTYLRNVTAFMFISLIGERLLNYTRLFYFDEV